MKNKSIRYATFFALATALISGVSNFLNKIAVTAVKDPVVFTTLKNTLVALFLIGLLMLLKKRREIASLSKNQIFKLAAIGALGGSIPFALFFIGLAQTSALNAALLHKTLFLWVALMAVPILKERIAVWQWVGVLAIFAANLLMGGFAGFKYNAGELMILAATILWAVENIISKTTLKDLSSVVVASARMVIGSLILMPVVMWRGGGEAVFHLNATQWSLTLIASALLFGYVLTWYTALKYAPAIYAAALLVPATLVTNVLSAIFITRSFTALQFFSSFLFVIGTALVIFFAKSAGDKIHSPQPDLRPSA